MHQSHKFRLGQSRNLCSGNLTIMREISAAGLESQEFRSSCQLTVFRGTLHCGFSRVCVIQICETDSVFVRFEYNLIRKL